MTPCWFPWLFPQSASRAVFSFLVIGISILFVVQVKTKLWVIADLFYVGHQQISALISKYSESSPSPPPLLVHPKPSHCQFLFRLVASQILFGRSDSIKTDQFISPLHLSLIMSSALHWKSNHCSQCSARFSRIWPLLHLWLYPLLPLLLRAHWPLCSSLTTWAYFHSSSFYTCCSLCLRGSSPRFTVQLLHVLFIYHLLSKPFPVTRFNHRVYSLLWV